MDNYLLETIICPVCNNKLEYDTNLKELICNRDFLAYPINNGIPILIDIKARKVFSN
ncbi:hypothetical protein CRV11_01225 [Candidatus Pantoea edessiphila]|uniref:Uncharacterized protein n=1 Tax=Candidatus Pantoea edessiphila TaxID=2044610 RepID=A0A2P5SYX8_9GAMM|nr:Trm112 family protein [Candidatus Pantoea edessiphila]MBK4775330.1 Trm112 family protein [Pantoea sp. Edef]PPI87535.1 hypothetical protein CRV11_01225 [Candidatus Pantoea edessiphila]